TWTRKASNETRAYSVSTGCHDNGNRCRRALGCKGRRSPLRHENVNVEAHQLCRQFWEPIVIPFGPAELDDNIPALDVAEITGPAGAHHPGAVICRVAPPSTQAPDPGALLRLRGCPAALCGNLGARKRADKPPPIHH